MSETETQDVSENEAKRPAPAAVKEAEVKLKEMSRKAKERKTASAPRKPPQRQSGSNLRLALIGGFGIGVLGILYFMLRKPKEEFVFTPNEGKEKPPKPVSPVKEKPPQSNAPETGFEMNSF